MKINKLERINVLFTDLVCTTQPIRLYLQYGHHVARSKKSQIVTKSIKKRVTGSFSV